jgi:DNA-directed RNA polymerase specialized sigma24 family protein
MSSYSATLLDQPEQVVASVLGVSAGSVKTHASRGLTALRVAMNETARAGEES